MSEDSATLRRVDFAAESTIDSKFDVSRMWLES